MSTSDNVKIEIEERAINELKELNDQYRKDIEKDAKLNNHEQIFFDRTEINEENVKEANSEMVNRFKDEFIKDDAYDEKIDEWLIHWNARPEQGSASGDELANFYAKYYQIVGSIMTDQSNHGLTEISSYLTVFDLFMIQFFDRYTGKNLSGQALHYLCVELGKVIHAKAIMAGLEVV